MENKNTLAKVAIAINVILLILIIILFSKIGSTKTVDTDVMSSADSDSTEVIDEPVAATGKVAYFNMDSLTANLLLYVEIEKEIQDASKAAERKMANEQRKIEKWQKKWADRGSLMSTEEEVYRKEAQDIQEKAMMFERNVQLKLQQEQEKYMSTLMLRISKSSSELAQKSGYDVINSYQLGQSPWYYNKTLDVTKELIEAMNADFKASSGMDDDGE